METAVDAKGCTFSWTIRNLNRWNWLKLNQSITSPVFVADALRKTKWALELYQSENNEFVGVNLHKKSRKRQIAPSDFKVTYEIAFMSEAFDTLVRETKVSNFGIRHVRGFDTFVDHKEAFFTERKKFVPEDTLTIECTLWHVDEKPDRFDHLFHTTVIEVKRRCFLWKIDKPLDLKSDLQNDFDHICKFRLRLNKDLSTMKLNLITFDEIVKYMSLVISIIRPEGGRELCKMHESDLNNFSSDEFPLPNVLGEREYFLNDDVLTFHVELVLLTVVLPEMMYNDRFISRCVENEESPSTDIPIPDPNLLYDETSTDIKLRTETKTFTAHKAILSAVSDKFRNMFLSNSEESIQYFEDDTVEEMLKYIYTGSLEGLNCERACDLHAISNYYGILSLKSLCFSFLQNKLREGKEIFVILVLSFYYDDKDVKKAVRKKILRFHKPVLQSPQWKDLMKHHELTAHLMHSFLRTE